MKILKNISLVLIILCIGSNVVWAEETGNSSTYSSYNLQISDGEMSNMVNEDTDVQIEVRRKTGNTVSVIYTGSVNGYQNGLLQNVDFDAIDMLIIFDWDSASDETIFVEVVKNDTDASDSVQSIPASVGIDSLNSNSLTVSDDISISSQIKINGVNVGEEGLRIIDNAKMNCNFSIINNSTSEKSVTTLLATYSQNGTLINVEAFSADVSGNDSENISFIYNFNAETEHSAKLMFWDSISVMRPIKASVDFSKTSGVNAYYYNADNRLLQIDKVSGTSLIYSYDNMGNQLTKTVRK